MECCLCVRTIRLRTTAMLTARSTSLRWTMQRTSHRLYQHSVCQALRRMEPVLTVTDTVLDVAVCRTERSSIYQHFIPQSDTHCHTSVHLLRSSAFFCLISLSANNQNCRYSASNTIAIMDFCTQYPKSDCRCYL